LTVSVRMREKGSMWGARVTDQVERLRQRGEGREAVREVRRRDPDTFRWRSAVAKVSCVVGGLRGKDRLLLEEPVREMVFDLPNPLLRREVVLDARRHRVDLDRGEILPRRTRGDLARVAFLAELDLDLVRRYVRLPDDFDAPIDTGGVVVVGRALSRHFRARMKERARMLRAASAPPKDSDLRRTVEALIEFDALDAKRYAALAEALLVTPA
jgi:hypothetical protein